jgi:hypothetical protein
MHLKAKKSVLSDIKIAIKNTIDWITQKIGSNFKE